MSGAEQLAVLLAGIGAGIMTSTVGVASLLSFPILLAVGLPPVVANATNTVGLTPGGLSGSFGYRAELRAHPAVATMVTVTCAIGAVLGAVLLLALPAEVFGGVAPWLILATCVVVGVQPQLNRWLRRRDTGPERTDASGPTVLLSLLVGVYGGYFGAGSGVMMMAVLGFGMDLDFRIVNALKTLAVLASNVIATVIFLLFADLDWRAVALLAVGSVLGGYVGAQLGRRLPATLLRTVIVVVGVVASVSMLA